MPLNCLLQLHAGLYVRRQQVTGHGLAVGTLHAALLCLCTLQNYRSFSYGPPVVLVLLLILRLTMHLLPPSASQRCAAAVTAILTCVFLAVPPPGYLLPPVPNPSFWLVHVLCCAVLCFSSPSVV
jgi:hypothetical protein